MLVDTGASISVLPAKTLWWIWEKPTNDLYRVPLRKGLKGGIRARV